LNDTFIGIATFRHTLCDENQDLEQTAPVYLAIEPIADENYVLEHSGIE